MLVLVHEASVGAAAAPALDPGRLRVAAARDGSQAFGGERAEDDEGDGEGHRALGPWAAARRDSSLADGRRSPTKTSSPNAANEVREEWRPREREEAVCLRASVAL